MTSAQIEKTVYAVIAKQFAIREDLVAAGMSLRDDLGADSTAMVELLINLEEALQAEMPDPSGQELRTVGEIIAFINERLPASGAS